VRRQRRRVLHLGVVLGLRKGEFGRPRPSTFEFGLCDGHGPKNIDPCFVGEKSKDIRGERSADIAFSSHLIVRFLFKPHFVVGSREVTLAAGLQETTPLGHSSGTGLWLGTRIISQTDGPIRFEGADSHGSAVTPLLPLDRL